MSRNLVLSLLGCLLLAACVFDAPLAPPTAVPLDPALLGAWEIVPDEGAEAARETVTVRADGDHRYAIEHRDGDSVIHFAGWLGELGGVRFIQLEVEGDENGPARADEPDRYSVLSYAISGDELVFRSLNTELVDAGLASTEALQQAFLAHRDDPALFIEPGRLRRP